MASWRDSILKEFVPEISRLTLVADPDGLLTEEGVLASIQERGFDLIPFDDNVTFRFVYESKYRSKWDIGQATDLVVVLRAAADDISKLPYDLLQAGRQLSFNLGDIFPSLSYPIVEQLDRADLDSLYEAQMEHIPGRLGDNATRDFILRHVFEIEPAMIREPSDLLRTLLRRHYRKRDVPSIFDDRFIAILSRNSIFADWPLKAIVPCREAFFAFLQERWPLYLNQLAATGAVRESTGVYCLEYPGTVDIPFGHDDVRVYIDNLFLEGLLRPIPHARAEVLTDRWVRSGIVTGESKDQLRRLVALVRAVGSDLPGEDARHHDWLEFSLKWGQALALRYACMEAVKGERSVAIDDLETEIDRRFANWLRGRYATLHNLPASRPAMVHHVPHYMARFLMKSESARVALVVVDGLAIDQWCAIREEIQSLGNSLESREDALFAWAPTITSVSRQAIFSGKVPLYFPDTIDSTDSERIQWTRFWMDRGVKQSQAFYAKGLGDVDSLDEISEHIENPDVRVIGLVVDKVDRIMHGMELGSAGMHSQIRQWAREGLLLNLLKSLHSNGIAVILTSDHGNAEAIGCGAPSEGVLADKRGERVRVYGNETFRKSCLNQFPSAVSWPSIGIPETYLPVIAPYGSAFVSKGKRTVAHGGVSIRELLVPFIRFDWRSE